MTLKNCSKNNLHSSITAEIIVPNAGLALRIFFFFSLCHSAINHSLAWILHAHLTSTGYIVPAPALVTSTPSLGRKLTAHRKVSWSDSETDFKWNSSTAIVCVRASVRVCVREIFTCSLGRLWETRTKRIRRFKYCVLDKWKSYIILCPANFGLLFLDEVQLNVCRVQLWLSVWYVSVYVCKGDY